MRGAISKKRGSQPRWPEKTEGMLALGVLGLCFWWATRRTRGMIGTRYKSGGQESGGSECGLGCVPLDEGLASNWKMKYLFSPRPLGWEADASQQLLITLVGAKGIESPVYIYVMERDILFL